MERRSRGMCGFTLMELLVTAAVLAILMTIGVPSLARLVERAREANALHLLTTSLVSARMAAVHYRTPVTMCPSSDAERCRPDPAWEDGWIIYADPDRDAQPKSPRHVLQRLDGAGPGMILRGTRGRTRIRFTPDGWAHGGNLTIRLCGTSGAPVRGKVVVNTAGRPRSERDASGETCPE